jgi:hypothetical protein
MSETVLYQCRLCLKDSQFCYSLFDEDVTEIIESFTSIKVRILLFQIFVYLIRALGLSDRRRRQFAVDMLLPMPGRYLRSVQNPLPHHRI